MVDDTVPIPTAFPLTRGKGNICARLYARTYSREHLIKEDYHYLDLLPLIMAHYWLGKCFFIKCKKNHLNTQFSLKNNNPIGKTQIIPKVSRYFSNPLLDLKISGFWMEA